MNYKRKLAAITGITALSPDGRTISMHFSTDGTTIKGLKFQEVVTLDRGEAHIIGDMINTWRNTDD